LRKIREINIKSPWLAFVTALALVLAFLALPVSALTGGTLAFRDATQFRSNVLSGGARGAQARLIKLEKDVNGVETENLLAGAAFRLYRVCEGGDELIGEYVTDALGVIELPVLVKEGRYYLLETAPPPGFALDRDALGRDMARYCFDATGLLGSGETLTLTVYNRHLDGNLIVEKRVRNSDGAPLTESQREAAFAFRVAFADGGSYPYALYDEKGERIPFPKADGPSSEDADGGAATGSAIEPGGGSGSEPGGGTDVEVTGPAAIVAGGEGSKDSSAETGEETAGAGHDGEGAAGAGSDAAGDGLGGESGEDGGGASPDSSPGVGSGEAAPGGGSGTEAASPIGGGAETGMTAPADDGAGASESEGSSEPHAPDSPESEPASGSSGGAGIGVMPGNGGGAENTGGTAETPDGGQPEGPRETGGESRPENPREPDGGSEARPDGNAEAEAGTPAALGEPRENQGVFASGGTLRLKHGQRAVFSGLPVGLGYTVEEEPVLGYVASGDGHSGVVTLDGALATFVNTTGGESEEATVTVSGAKTWDMSKAPTGTAIPSAITIFVWNGGMLARTLTVTAADGWRWSAVLPKYDAQGNEIAYRVSEAALPGYRATVNGFDVTNAYLGDGSEGPGKEDKDPTSTGGDGGAGNGVMPPANVTVPTEPTPAGAPPETADLPSDGFEIEDGMTPMEAFPESTETGGTAPSGVSPSGVPKTGDESKPGFWLMLTVASALGLAIILRPSRRRKEENAEAEANGGN
jgi:hypothetical protein